MDRKGLFVWLLLLVSCTHAAFIRHLPCGQEVEALTEPVFETSSLTGSLDNDGDTTSLSLELTGDFLDDRCEELNGASAVLMLDARVLGNSVADGKPWRMNATCPSLTSKTNPRYDWRTYAVYEAAFPLDHSFRFSSLDTTIQLYLNETQIACMRAQITPYIGSVAPKVIMGFPLAIMILSGIVTGAFKTYQQRRSSSFRYELENDLRDPVESAIPGLGPCLHHIQFMFLTGCLTLPYPGFFRASMSCLSWSSLIFKNWPVTHQFTYPGVEDGLYSVNATYGLEEMAQYLGSTTTSDLWTNSIVNLALLVAGTIVMIQLGSICHSISQLYTSQSLSPPSAGAYLKVQLPAVLRRTGWGIVRVVLDYFLLPLLCFSLFQMNNAQWFPVYHTSLALIAVAILAGMLVLVVCRLEKTDRQAVFFQHTFLPGSIGQHWGFYTLYGIPFIRAIAIGGLQLSGLAQIVILLGCETWILACGFWNLHSGLTWRPALLALARLAAVLMSFAFVPQVGANDRTKGIVAYCILSLHLLVLVGGLVVDCVFEPLRYTLYKHGLLDSEPRVPNPTSKAPVFGIAQLSHRPERRFSFAHLSALDPEGLSTPHTRKSSSRCPGSSGRPESSGSSRSPSDTAHSPSSTRSHTASPGSNNDLEFSPLSIRSPQGSRSQDSESNTDSAELASLDDFTEVPHTTEYYAQRESDQFYHHRDHPHAPRRPDPHADSESSRQPTTTRTWPWKGRPKKKEKGFEVFRPAATPRALPTVQSEDSKGHLPSEKLEP
ncbi:uncharacterized protein BDV17DRAFT_294433 [Aspergillus undulatus]|uniref:uncharacterized protein n=1 Tax=Aspergillus undulatus TaxID=1810928 RepID=UPI003CCD41F1